MGEEGKEMHRGITLIIEGESINLSEFLDKLNTDQLLVMHNAICEKLKDKGLKTCDSYLV